MDLVFFCASEAPHDTVFAKQLTDLILLSDGRNDRVSSDPSSYRCGYSYSFDRLPAAHWHRSEPAVTVALLAAHDGVELLLDRPGDGANPALAHLDLVHGTDRRDFCCRPGEECLGCDVEHLPRNHLLDNRKVEVARNLHHGVACDSRENRTTQRRRDQLLSMHHEHIHPRSLTHKAVDVEGNAFGKAEIGRAHV